MLECTKTELSICESYRSRAASRDRRRLASRRMMLEVLENRLVMSSLGGGFTSAGLLGDYFANPDLQGAPAFVRRDVRIDFDWGTTTAPGGSTNPALRQVGVDDYSVRWTGQLIPRFSEPYTLRLSTSDGVRLAIRPAGSTTWTTVIDQWNNSSNNTFTGTYPFTAGAAYDVRLEYREDSGPARVQLAWSAPSVPLETIEPLGQIGVNTEGAAFEIFADTIRTGRAEWGNPNNYFGSPLVALDAQGWPTADATNIVWEGRSPEKTAGTYLLVFQGRARVSTQSNASVFRVNGVSYGNSLPFGVGYDAATNTTTALVDLPGLDILYLSFRDTRRTPASTTNDGVTQVQLYRPISPGSSIPHDRGEYLARSYKNAVSSLTTLRWLTVNFNTNEVTWNDRILPDQPRVLRPWNPRPTWEHQVMVSNETGRDLYITIPVAADNDYVTRLAKLIRYGSDGVNPYNGPTANPVYPPLNSNLKVYVEWTNEVWNWAFSQSNRAVELAREAVHNNTPDGQIINFDGSAPNGNYLRWMALRTVRASEIFRSVFGDAAMGDRVRVLYEYQYDNAQDSAMTGLRFLDDYFNNGDGQTHVANPKPVSYFIWGGGGATYYGSGNSRGLQTEMSLVNPGFESPVVSGRVVAPAGAGWTFTGNAGIERATSFEGGQRAFLGANGAMSQTITITTPGQYALEFRAAVKSGSNMAAPLWITVNGQNITPGGPIRRDPASHLVNPGTFTPPGRWGQNATNFVRYGSVVFDAPTAGSYTIQISTPATGERETYLDDLRLVSLDAIFAGGIPGSGEANGQIAQSNYQRQLHNQARWAQSFGLNVVAYEGGWSLGGDFEQLPIQNHAKFLDPRAAQANQRALDAFSRSGGVLNVHGTYFQWYDLDNIAVEPIYQSWSVHNNTLRVEPTNGNRAPTVLLPGDREAAVRTNGAILNAYGWMAFNVIIPTLGDYEVIAYTTSGGQVRLELGAGRTVLGNGVSGQPVSGVATLTPGVHSVMVRSQGGSFTLNRVEVRPVGTLAPPILQSAADGDQYVDLTWSPVAGATGYLVRWGTQPGLYDQELVVGPSVTNQRISGLTNGTNYVFAVSTLNDRGPGLPSNELAAIPMADGQLSALAFWELTNFLGNEVNAPRTGGTNRITSTPLSRGPALRLPPNWATNSFPRRLTASVQGNRWATNRDDAMQRGEYYEFQIQPAPNQLVTLTELNFQPFFQNNPASAGVAVAYSLDNGATFQYLPTTGTINSAQGITANLAGIPGLIDRADPVTFRLVYFGAQDWTITGVGFGDPSRDLTLTGSIRQSAAPPVVVPEVESLQVHASPHPQRSMVREWLVAFSTAVQLAPTAFRLVPANGGAAVPLTWTTQLVNGKTVATVRLATGNSVADGWWRLEVVASAVSSTASNTAMTQNASLLFHRLFGDSDGDGDVDNSDLRNFRLALAGAYVHFFDSDDDGDVDNSDLIRFRANLGRRI